jgi:maleylpyruvate isomerase
MSTPVIDGLAPRTHGLENHDEELLWARRGTAYFARKLNELHDELFHTPSLLPGWERAHVIAHVGYNARGIARLIEWAATGVETPMYSSPRQRNEEIEFGATLTPIALRNLFDHAAVHLNVEWRDLSAAGWQAEVVTAQGRTVHATETAWMRAREVWIHAIDLDNGASYVDFPPEFVDALVQDVVGAWQRKGERADVVLQPTDRAYRASGGGSDDIVVNGTAADIARWLTGRGARRLTVTGADALPELPHWL